MAKRSAQAILSTPAYPFGEAAHYLNIPLSTLRAWCLGQGFAGGGKSPAFKPVMLKFAGLGGCGPARTDRPRLLGPIHKITGSAHGIPTMSAF